MGRFAWGWLLWPRLAAADPITDRDYAIELYEGVAIGDSSMTAMGGAGAARVTGSAGTLLNPSAAAVRRTTDNDRWSWDYHVDFLTGRFSTDYDNNGIAAATDSGAQLVTGGLALRFGKWAFAGTGIGQNAPVDGSSPQLDASALRVKLAVARWFPSIDLAIGAAIHTVTFTLGPHDSSQKLFEINAAGIALGATYVPRKESFRIGIALESRVVGGDVTTQDCDPMNCMGYILPNTIESPGRTIVGLAYRWAATPWNQQVPTRWRDEPSVTLATDLVIAGSSIDGNGIEGFAARELQPSGRSITVSPRAGVEVEALPGRLRVRGGTYWEPARFDNVAGRVHGTFGFELRALEFSLWGMRRGRLGATADLAARYRNLGVSIGFWH